MRKFFQYLSRNHILMALVIVLLGWFFLSIRNTLVIFFIAYIIMAGLSPLVDYLERKRLPRVLAVLLPYVSALALIILIITVLAPRFLSEFQDFFKNLPLVLDKAGSLLNVKFNSAESLSSLFSLLNINPSNILDVTGKLSQAVFTAVAIFVISIYMLLSRQYTRKLVASLFPESSREKVRGASAEAEAGLGRWFRGQLILSLVVGVIVWIFLMLAGVEFSGALGLLAGLAELVPFAGPILAAIPAVIIALNVSLTKAVIVIVGYIIIQQLENHLLVPNVMKRSVGLPPLAIIAVVLAGAELAGLMGVLIAVPLVVFVKAVYQSFSRP